MASLCRSADIWIFAGVWLLRRPLYKRPNPADSGAIDIFGADRAMRISVLALEGVFDTGLTTVLDALGMANTLAQWTGMLTPGFEVTVVGARPEVRTGHGLRVPVVRRPSAVYCAPFGE